MAEGTTAAQSRGSLAQVRWGFRTVSGWDSYDPAWPGTLKLRGAGASSRLEVTAAGGAPVSESLPPAVPACTVSMVTPQGQRQPCSAQPEIKAAGGGSGGPRGH